MSPFVVGLVVFAVLILLIALGVAIRRFARRGRAGPYERRDFLTPAERSFFGVLREAVGDEHLIFAKVRVADLLKVRRGVSQPQAHLNRIIAKHVDFVLCYDETVSPQLVIELDDASHAQQERQDRDRFLNEAFSKAGLPLVRVPARRAYDVASVRTNLNAALGNRAVLVSPLAASGGQQPVSEASQVRSTEPSTPGGPSRQQPLAKVESCIECAKILTSGERAYCERNAARLGGRMLCFRHQRRKRQ